MGKVQDLFYIMDGNSFVHRAKHRLEEKQSSTPEPERVRQVTALALDFICQELDRFQPSHASIVFDGHGKTYRHTIYPPYKATREEQMGCNIIPESIEQLKEGAEYMGIHPIQEDDVEADDVIADLTTLTNEMPIIISTRDKDLNQLVSKNISLYSVMDKRTLTEKSVYAKYGVYPNQFADYLAMIGDKADNIPGIPGVGPQTAVRILKKYGSVDKFLSHKHEDQKKINLVKKFKDNRFYLMKELTTVGLNPIESLQEYTIEDFVVKGSEDETALKQWVNKIGINPLPLMLQEILGGVRLRVRKLI